MNTVVLVVVALFGVTLHAFQVCHEPYGCFSTGPPFHIFLSLPQSPSKVGTSFHLFTRSNRETAQIIHDNDEAELMASDFDFTKRTVFVVHGFTENIKTWAPEIKDALLDQESCNVILVDWSEGAKIPYNQAAGNTRLVGAQVAKLIELMSSISPGYADQVCIVGFSMGAQIAGFAGNTLRNQGSALGRITGLDPAGPLYTLVGLDAKLDPSDAQYVDVIHTDAGFIGTIQKVGHVDFYANGGSKQRGCPRLFRDIMKWMMGIFEGIICDHMRAPAYYIETIKGDCPWTAYPCSDYKTFERGKCLKCDGECPSMGYGVDQTKPEGKFYLMTNEEAPFCDEKPEEKDSGWWWK